MQKSRLLGAGIFLFIATGCANQPKLTPIASRANSTARSTVAVRSTPPATTTPSTDQPKWEASSTPAELLAQKTAAYAKALQTADSVDQGDAPQPEVSAALLGTPRKHHHEDPTFSQLTAAQPPAPAPTVIAPPALITPAASVASASPADEPKIMPESADFGGGNSAVNSAGDSAGKDALGVRLRKRTRENPRDIADQLDLQLYGMLNDDPSPELAAVTELPDDDRELVAALIDGITNFRSTVREDANMLQAKKIQPLLEMADRLRSQADLTVSTVALCRRVDGFGKYEPITPVRFPAMQENAAIVYCEVENFLPKQEGPMWKTKLTEQVTVYSDMGVLAWSDDKREINDECRNRRHDFFAYDIVRLPNTLTVGRYVLKVSIEDKNADRIAEATVPLEIVAN